MQCDKCRAENKTVGFVDSDMTVKLCQPCDREYLLKQGYE